MAVVGTPTSSSGGTPSGTPSGNPPPPSTPNPNQRPPTPNSVLFHMLRQRWVISIVKVFRLLEVNP